MSSEHPLLEVQVHDVSGQVTKFTQDDPAKAQHILDGLGQPSRLFLQPQLILGGDGAMSIFRCSWVTRLDIIADRLPSWPYLQGANSVEEISEETFHVRFDPAKYAELRKKVWVGAERTQIGFTEIATVTGEHLFWEVVTEARIVTATDLNPYVQTLLGSGGLHAHRRDRGVMIINPANITRLTFHPGPTHLPPNAWNMQRL